MGRSKRLQLSHRRNSGNKNIQFKSGERRRSLLTLVSPEDVTEGSLQVWRSLPTKIRQDPSLAPFQFENERINGVALNDVGDDASDAIEFELTGNLEVRNDLIHIQVTNEDGIDSHIEDICTIQKGSSVTNMTNTPSTHSMKSLSSPWHKHPKLIFLFCAWFLSMAFMTTEEEKRIHHKLISIDDFNAKNYSLPNRYFKEQIALSVEGPFLKNGNENHLEISLLSRRTVADVGGTEIGIGQTWRIPIANHNHVETIPTQHKRHVFSIDYSIYRRQSNLIVALKKNTPGALTVKLGYDPSPVEVHVGAICAALILLLLYVLIIYEIVHRTFAAIFTSVVAIGILAALNDRPTMHDVVEWMNSETLLLLFSMMILVAILTETGVFNFLAVYAFQITNGRIWSLIIALCIITAVMSAFLDNVTTILLMTPVTIKLCECMGLDPKPILMAVIVTGNIGAVATPLGHIPNLLITGNPFFARHDITFLSYTTHMSIGVILVIIQTCMYLRWEYNDIHKLRTKMPKHVADLQKEILVWKRTASSLSMFTRDAHIVRDTLLKKVKILQGKLKEEELKKVLPAETYRTTLEELKQNYPIKNSVLLLKATAVLVFVLSLFFLQSFPGIQNLSLGWCALIGVIFLLIIAERDDMDSLMHRIEWTTLLFFAAMFITIECLERLRLIYWIGEQAKHIILAVDDPSYQLTLAILIILWVSALLSALVDSIPVTAMMIKVVISIVESGDMNIPVQPLVWAVAFGPCLGGNGTLYGATANIICAGIAEQHGYKISFSKYFKKCFPIMIASLISTSVYLIITQVIFHWYN